MLDAPEKVPATLATVALETVGRAQRDAPFKAVLINPYELGRQRFALAEPAAWLKGAGFEVALHRSWHFHALSKWAITMLA